MTADRASGPQGIDELLSHAAWLRGLAAALVRDPAAADDLVQDTWVAAMKRPPPPHVAPRAWLTGIARNLARFSLRTGARRARREQSAAPREALPDGAELVERLETQRRLAALVAELEEPVRSIVLLRFYEGLDAAEIARRRGEPAGTVRWRLKQGLDELRARLDASSGGDRDRWQKALAPLALPQTGGWRVPSPGAAVGWGGGGIVMASSSKLAAAGLAALLLVAGGLWFALREDGPPSDTRSAPSAAGEGDAERAAAAAATEKKRPRVRAEDAAAGVPAAAPASVTPATPARASGVRIAGRLVDPAGAPVGGGSARLGYGGRPVRASVDGRFAVDVPMARDTESALVVLAAPGRILRVLTKQVARGADVDLGDVTLAAGGVVSGRIVDDGGSPVSHAWIVLTSVPVENADAAPKLPVTGAPGGPDTEMTFGADGLSMLDLEPSPRGPVVTADADGAFTAEGLPVGRATVLRAGAQGHRSATSKVTARAGAPVTDVRIVVPRLRDDEGIEGRVVAPDGSPAAGIDFVVEFDGTAIRGASTGHTDAEGRFHLQTLDPTTYSIRIEDTSRGWTSERVAGLLPGRRDVVLRALVARTAEIVALAPDGAPIATFSFEVTQDGGPDGVAGSRAERAAPERPARVLLPGGAFSVTVEAPGFATGRLAHLDAAACGERIVVEMKPLPAWRGVVRSAKGPVAGATVTLHRAAAEGVTMFTMGFPLTRETFEQARTTTDAAGSFELTVREEAGYVVCATAAGLAAGETGVVRLGPGGGELPAVELTQGGAIEGTVTTGGTRSPEGIVVGASRCDGSPRFVKVGADGRFRFERLTPGPWIVKTSEEFGGTAPVLLFQKTLPIEWNCDVRAGETTRHDLALGAAAPCVVRGRFTATGERAWAAGLAHLDLDRGSTDERAVPVGTDGAFEISTERTGDHWLLLMTPKLETRVYLPVKLAAGEVRRDLALSFGRVEVDASGPNAKASRTVVWEGEGGAFAMCRGEAGDGGRIVFPLVPAGKVRIVRYDPAVKGSDPRKWIIDAEFEVPAGGTRALDLK